MGASWPVRRGLSCRPAVSQVGYRFTSEGLMAAAGIWFLRRENQHLVANWIAASMIVFAPVVHPRSNRAYPSFQQRVWSAMSWPRSGLWWSTLEAGALVSDGPVSSMIPFPAPSVSSKIVDESYTPMTLAERRGSLHNASAPLDRSDSEASSDRAVNVIYS